MTASHRSLTVEWEDPLLAAERSFELSGLDALQAIAAGAIALPPIAALLGFEPVAVEEGVVALSAVPGEQHYSSNAAVHGGLAAAMLDSAMYLAVHSTLPRATFASTLEIKVNYVRPMTAETGAVTATGRIVHRGNQVATAGGELTQPDGKLIAHGSATCLIRTL